VPKSLFTLLALWSNSSAISSALRYLSDAAKVIVREVQRERRM